MPESSTLLGRAFTMEPADYLSASPPRQADPETAFEELGYEFHDFGVEQSAPSRGLLVWALLKEISLEGMRHRVTRHLDCARRVADRVRVADELELLAEPTLSICCFRYRPEGVEEGAALDAFNEAGLTSGLVPQAVPALKHAGWWSVCHSTMLHQS